MRLPRGRRIIRKAAPVAELSTEWMTLRTTDGPMRAYVARPASTPNGAVVLLQEAFGVNDHIQDITRRFADRGYHAVAPELFHRTGPEVIAYDDHPQAMALIGALGPEQITTDATAVLEHLDGEESIDLTHTAIVGFCFGGRAAFTAATATPGLGAAVVFYGPGIAAGPFAVADRAGSITAPMLMHVGADDPTIPAEHVDVINNAMSAVGTEFVQHVYPGAGHAFACDARPQMYRQDAAEAAWARTYEFLHHHLPSAA